MGISTSYCLERERGRERRGLSVPHRSAVESVACGAGWGQEGLDSGLRELEAGQEGESPSSSHCLGQTLEIW